MMHCAAPYSERGAVPLLSGYWIEKELSWRIIEDAAPESTLGFF